MASDTPAGHGERERELREWGVGYGGKTGEFMGRYVQLDETGTQAIIERPGGGTRDEYLWHLSPTDLAYIQTDLSPSPTSSVE